MSGRSHVPIALSSHKSVQPVAIPIPTEVPGVLASNTDVYSSKSGEPTGLGSQLGDKLFEPLSGPLFTYGVTVRVLVSPSQCQNVALIIRQIISRCCFECTDHSASVCKRLCSV